MTNELTLREEIKTLLDARDFLRRNFHGDELDGYNEDFASDAAGLLVRAYNELPLETAPSPIKVGDRIKSKRTGEYLGVVTDVSTVYLLRYKAAQGIGVIPADDTEVAPPLTPEVAWSEVPLLIIHEIYDRGVRLHLGLDADDQRAIRGHCYKLLGGAKIKITPEVKARVRQIIIDVAGAVGAVVY